MYNIVSTIKKISRYFKANDLFFGHGTENSWDEAVFLVLSVCKVKTRNSKLLSYKYISPKHISLIWFLAQKRIATRKPMAYILKRAYLAGEEFEVNENVMIPRSPIAELLVNKLKPWVNPDKISNILDLCTGSGCLAILGAKHFKESKVVAIDISKEALKVARKNIDKHHLKSRVKWLHSDLFENININHKFDLIISNPPYVGIEEFARLPIEYYKEPKLAFLSENNGLEIAIKIFSQAHKYLEDNGVIVVELGNSADLMQEKYPQIPFVHLEFLHGGHGVLLLTKQHLEACKDVW